MKHDCAAVMELHGTRGRYRTAAGAPVAIESTHVFPLLKSAALARGALTPVRHVVLPQRSLDEDPAQLARTAPRTWRYLVQHRADFARRGSSIYRDKPPFSIFGVGPYSFAPWKVAIAGLGRALAFRVVGPHRGKPVVFDDTCYFLPCATEAEARRLHRLLSSRRAREFYGAFVFWDAKRPITAELLRRLDLAQLRRAAPRT